MEWFKQLGIYLFPIVMLLTIGMNNWKREERTQGDRVFGFLPFLIICMMGSDVTYHALQLFVHRFAVLYAGYLVYCFFLTAVPHAWLLYVNGKLSVRHNRRWTAVVCHTMTGIAIAAVLLTVIVPWSLSTEGWGAHAVSYSLSHGSLPAKLVSIVLYLTGLILAATAYPKEVTKEGQKETRYLLEAGVFGKDPVFLARYGGDEFAVLGDWFGQEQIEEAIARIRDGIDRFNKEGQLPLQLSMSIGYAFWHEAGRRGENLIQQADERMYEEKQEKKRTRA